MLVIFHPDATASQIEAVLLRIEKTGAGAQRVDGAEQTVVGVIDADRDHIASLELDADAGVDRVVRVSSPYKLAHKHRHGGSPHPVDIGGVAGDEVPTVEAVLTAVAHDITGGVAALHGQAESVAQPAAVDTRDRLGQGGAVVFAV